jgi:hypothetical protein
LVKSSAMRCGNKSLLVFFETTTSEDQQKLEDFLLGFPPGYIDVEPVTVGAWVAQISPGGALEVGK